MPLRPRGTDATALLQHGDHRQRGLRALVAVATAKFQAVMTAASTLVEHGRLGVVVAEKPRHAQANAVQPTGVAGHRGGACARVGERGDLDWPLVEAGAGLAPAPP